MFINTRVVVALMRLRSISLDVLGGLLHVPQPNLLDWLVHEKDDAVDFETQLEALKLLGINNDKPRNDVVHYWRIAEPFFGNTHDIYHDLIVILETFGTAQAVHITSMADPLLTTEAKTHFGLRFGSFYAMLEVTGHPLRSLRFDPAKINGLDWVEGVHCVMLENHDYSKLEPGAMRVGKIQQHLSYHENKSAWDELQSKAAQHSLPPQSLAVLVELVNNLQLGHDSSVRNDALASILSQRSGLNETRVPPVAPIEVKPQPSATIEDIPAAVRHVPSQEEVDDLLFTTPVVTPR